MSAYRSFVLYVREPCYLQDVYLSTPSYLVSHLLTLRYFSGCVASMGGACATPSVFVPLLVPTFQVHSYVTLTT
jgi:hypothetical protein